MSSTLVSQAVRIGAAGLDGDLTGPAPALGVVVFVHGSGSNRASARHAPVAAALHGRGLATLLFDLLTPSESAERANTFDIDLLAGRTGQAIDWLHTQPALATLPLGLFGASTGAAAALVAAARRPDRVRAVVSRGGRPDLARDWLPRVRAPTLLIVGGLDNDVLALNRDALRRLGAARRLEVVPGAGHLFGEPGALDSVAALAAAWFDTHLVQERPR